MDTWIVELAGWVPALIIPLATTTQLLQVLRSPSAAGVSALTWALFGVANVGMYVFTEKWLAPQSLLGFVATALLDFAIVGLVLRKRQVGGR